MKSTKENLQILYEDNHLIVVNKRAGDIVQGDKTGDPPLSDIVKAYLKEKYQKPGEVFLGVVHRLDRPTTGIVVFARTSKALSRLNEAFKERQTLKTYWAVTCACPSPEKGTLIHWMQRNTEKNKSRAFQSEGKDRKKAVLHYEVKYRLERYFLLEIVLETGRHHQIRAQLQAVGCSIKGDLKYGAPRNNPDASIHLHARQLEFTHPVQRKPLIIVAEPPDHDSVWKAVSKLP